MDQKRSQCMSQGRHNQNLKEIRALGPEKIADGGTDEGQESHTISCADRVKQS